MLADGSFRIHVHLDEHYSPRLWFQCHRVGRLRHLEHQFFRFDSFVCHRIVTIVLTGLFACSAAVLGDSAVMVCSDLFTFSVMQAQMGRMVWTLQDNMGSQLPWRVAIQNKCMQRSRQSVLHLQLVFVVIFGGQPRRLGVSAIFFTLMRKLI